MWDDVVVADEQTFTMSYLDHDGDEPQPRSLLLSARDVERFMLIGHGFDPDALAPDDDEDLDDD